MSSILRRRALAALALTMMAATAFAQVSAAAPTGGAAMNHLHWRYIALAAVLPPAVGLIVAFPFWRKRRMTLGNIFAAAIIFATSIGLILREYAELDRITTECLDAGIPCFPVPSAFTRFAIYAFIGLLQVIALFSLSLIVEDRIRRKDYAPEWR